jgi:hypothetical protein
MPCEAEDDSTRRSKPKRKSKSGKKNRKAASTLKAPPMILPVTLLPCALEPGQTIPNFGYSTLCMDANQAGDKIALRDPRTPSRLNIWTDRGERLIGYEPDAKKGAIERLGWAEGDRLLIRTPTGISGWDASQGKAAFEFAGTFDRALIAPNRKWVVLTGDNGIDFLDTSTGQQPGAA